MRCDVHVKHGISLPDAMQQGAGDLFTMPKTEVTDDSEIFDVVTIATRANKSSQDAHTDSLCTQGSCN